MPEYIRTYIYVEYMLYVCLVYPNQHPDRLGHSVVTMSTNHTEPYPQTKIWALYMQYTQHTKNRLKYALNLPPANLSSSSGIAAFFFRGLKSSESKPNSGIGAQNPTSSPTKLLWPLPVAVSSNLLVSHGKMKGLKLNFIKFSSFSRPWTSPLLARSLCRSSSLSFET